MKFLGLLAMIATAVVALPEPQTIACPPANCQTDYAWCKMQQINVDPPDFEKCDRELSKCSVAAGCPPTGDKELIRKATDVEAKSCPLCDKVFNDCCQKFGCFNTPLNPAVGFCKIEKHDCEKNYCPGKLSARADPATEDRLVRKTTDVEVKSCPLCDKVFNDCCQKFGCFNTPLNPAVGFCKIEKHDCEKKYCPGKLSARADEPEHEPTCPLCDRDYDTCRKTKSKDQCLEELKFCVKVRCHHFAGKLDRRQRTWPAPTCPECDAKYDQCLGTRPTRFCLDDLAECASKTCPNATGGKREVSNPISRCLPCEKAMEICLRTRPAAFCKKEEQICVLEKCPKIPDTSAPSPKVERQVDVPETCPFCVEAYKICLAFNRPFGCDEQLKACEKRQCPQTEKVERQVGFPIPIDCPTCRKEYEICLEKNRAWYCNEVAADCVRETCPMKALAERQTGPPPSNCPVCDEPFKQCMELGFVPEDICLDERKVCFINNCTHEIDERAEALVECQTPPSTCPVCDAAFNECMASGTKPIRFCLEERKMCSETNCPTPKVARAEAGCEDCWPQYVDCLKHAQSPTAAVGCEQNYRQCGKDNGCD